MMIPFLQKVASGLILHRHEMEAAMECIMSGEATQAQIGAFVTGLRVRGETAEEIAGAAAVMRQKAVKITTARPNGRPLLDTCGTGGDRQGTFNISTAAAFAAAGAGAIVAKHGNRGVSSSSGSADVLEALDVTITIPPEAVGRCIDEIGIGFLFAPQLHAAMKHVASTRRELGFRTIFNILGPLTNPADAETQVVGVYDPALCRIIAEVLLLLGTRRAMVVHGDGLDEITTAGTTKGFSVNDGAIEEFTLEPRRYGLAVASVQDLKGGTPEENARIIEEILAGKKGPKRDVVILNAAAGLVVSGTAPDLETGLKQAAAAIDSGAAMEKLRSLRELTAALQ